MERRQWRFLWEWNRVLASLAGALYELEVSTRSVPRNASLNCRIKCTFEHHATRPLAVCLSWLPSFTCSVGRVLRRRPPGKLNFRIRRPNHLPLLHVVCLGENAKAKLLTFGGVHC
ncbi:hypothetical protein BDN71DRAFT_1181989 [Pleurotus eryngii]|uniref:Secreted protein n=1 Tax=Pleurotus eryngii TaxID=5323 RepID=A0A9P5ZRU9_PLEER|nr:hypothetical protein BDN71DRAFT_1181989 [Pleurotus eryngii]